MPPALSPHSSAPHRPSRLSFAMKVIFFLVGLGLCGVIALCLAIALAWPSLPNLQAMSDYRPRIPLRIYTADNVLMGEFGEERRNVLQFNEIPEVMKQAVLAAEDDRFYQHRGIAWTGVLRAIATNILHQAKSQGASTITMQVARNFYLSSEKTYTRKLYELLLTFKIESAFTKDQILELYMNQIYLGHRAYGFAAAARTYFGKLLANVTPAEAAVLAGIPKAPSRYNPIANLERAQIRQHYVLGRMRALNYLNQEQYDAALAQPLTIRSLSETSSGNFRVHGEYPAELARQLMYTVFGEETYYRGLNVYTTIKAKDQAAAYKALRTGILGYTRRAPYPGPAGQIDLPTAIENDPKAFKVLINQLRSKYPDSDDLHMGIVLAASPTQITVARNSRDIVTIDDPKALAIVARALAPNVDNKGRIQRGAIVYVHKNNRTWEVLNMPTLQGALIALSPNDGSIQAMIGGFDFYRGTFNRAVQAWRQPGSDIKPFVYAAALERGLTPATVISDMPFALTAEQTGKEPWNPKNDSNAYEPMITLRQALYYSKNMVSIRILQAITPAYGQQVLTRFGFQKGAWPAVLSIALGAGAATPLQVTNAYAAWANGGYRVTPTLIARVTDSSGKVLMQARPEQANTESNRVVDPRIAWVMDNMLRGVATYGTASRTRRALKRDDIGGKTGTTNDSVDIWFSGYTPAVSATVWMGFDQPRSLGSNEFGAGLTLSSWAQYMQTALKDVPVIAPRPQPPGLIVDNGEYYLAEFPPGQAVVSLDLPTDNPLADFLNQGNPASLPMINSPAPNLITISPLLGAPVELPPTPPAPHPEPAQPAAPASPDATIYFPPIPVPQ